MRAKAAALFCTVLSPAGSHSSGSCQIRSKPQPVRRADENQCYFSARVYPGRKGILEASPPREIRATSGAATRFLVFASAAVTATSCGAADDDSLSYPPLSGTWQLAGDFDRKEAEVAQFVADALNAGIRANYDDASLSEWENRIRHDYLGARPGLDQTGGFAGRIVGVEPGPSPDTFEVSSCVFNTPGIYTVEDDGSLKPRNNPIASTNYYVIYTTEWSRGGQDSTEPRPLMYAVTLGSTVLDECRKVAPGPQPHITPTPIDEN